MIRILAISISAAALVAATIPASAQHRQQGPQGQNFRSQPTFSGPQFRGQQQFTQQPSAQRNFRSFNPPAPVAQGPGQARPLSRGLQPPTPGVSQRSFGPQAPGGGQNFAGGPRTVPAALPVSPITQSNPTAAPVGPQQLTDTGQTTPQGDLQAPIPETVSQQDAPQTVAQQGQPLQPSEEMPAAEGEEQPQDAAAAPEGDEEAGTADPKSVGKVVRTGKIHHKHVIKKVYRPHVVYKEVYVAKPVYVHHVYRPHHFYVAPRLHFGHHHFHHGRRW
jgi:hypothetical protein